MSNLPVEGMQLPLRRLSSGEHQELLSDGGSHPSDGSHPGGLLPIKRGLVTEILETSRTIKAQLVIAGVYALVSIAKNVSYFPFLRTTIACDSTIASVNDTSGSDWSGSSHCTDLHIVAKQAQFVKGLSEGLDQTIHCLALPMLGHAIDCFGRRWGVLCGMSGIFFQCLFYLFATLAPPGTWSHVLVVIGSLIQGATGVFVASVNASVRDIQLRDEGGAHESQAFGAMQVSQGSANSIAVVLTTVLIVSRNLDSYTGVFIAFSSLALMVVAGCYCFYQETIHEMQPWQWRKASPFNVIVLFYESPSHKWIGLGVFFATFSLTSFAILQAFTIHEYHWTQTYSTVIFLILSPFAVVSLSASFFMIPRFGPIYVITVTFYLLNATMISFCLASISSIFVFLGVGCLMLTTGTMPAMMQVITSTCEKERTGEVLANVGAVCLAAIAIGNLLYGAVFSSSAPPATSFYVAAPLMWMATFCASRAKVHILPLMEKP